MNDSPGASGAPASPAPELSVLVNIVDGGDALRRVLRAIASQQDAPVMQVLVPYDDSVAGIAAIAREFPEIEFVDLGAVPTEHPIATPAGQHELYDRRRAAGLQRARAEVIALLEDRGAPRPEWARALLRRHREVPHAVIGGAVECAPASLLNWAFWACDYSRYGLPFTSGPRNWLSDVNVSYKKRILESVDDVWRDGYNEARVHQALTERGETLYLANDAIVDLRTTYRSLGHLLPERMQWGRVFGAARTAALSPRARLRLIAAGPLLPFVLLLRQARTQRAMGNGYRFALAIPFMLPMLAAWTAGEVWGYVTRRR